MDSVANEPRGLGELLAITVDTYWPPLKASLIVQAVILLYESLLLTAESPLRPVLVWKLSYWAMFAIIVCRRPTSPTKIDLVMVRYGFLFIPFLAPIAALICSLFRGPFAL